MGLSASLRLAGAATLTLLLRADLGLAQDAAPVREIAVTFDDLPAVSVADGRPAALATFTDRLLATFAVAKVPVVGFVNEGKLVVGGEGLAGQAARIDLLRKWVDAGFELGNHTYAHGSLNDTPIEEFEADVVRGERVVQTLLAARGRTLRYFRHPFLQVGLDLAKREAFEDWLARRGYTVAPVTIDNDEYIFAAVYAAALKSGDRATADRAAAAYLAYMDSVFAFNESLSQDLFGRPIRFILLVHANQLNADHAGALFALLKQRGYAFVTLDRALEDPAYRSPDRYVGRWGISWMHHWEQAMGRKRTGSPDPPAWVTEAYEKGRR